MATPQSVFVMLKPAAFERDLVGRIIAKLIEEGFSISDQRVISHPPKELIAVQYPEEEFAKTNRSFSRERIINYCARGPIMVIILTGENAIQRMKDLKGSPDPKLAKPGTIRSWVDDTIEKADVEKRALRDLIHSSDNATETALQLKTWFTDTNDKSE